jgi:hypothetical protein
MGQVFGDVRSFLGAVEGAASLALLRQIDEAVDALVARGKAFGSLAEMGRRLAEVVGARETATGRYVDPDDELCSLLKDVAATIEADLPKLVARKSSIDRDSRLGEDHCELLHSAYDEAIAATGALVEAVKDLRAAIIRADLEAEPRTGCTTFGRPADLVEHLRNNDAT